MVGGVRWGSRCGRICSTPPGWGFLLRDVGYSAARMLLVQAKRYALSATPLCWPWGAFVPQRGRRTDFYAGQPRWYTLAGCVLCFWSNRAALGPLLSGVEAFVRWCLAWPFVMLWRAVLRRLRGAVFGAFFSVRTALCAGRVKKKAGRPEKRLQNSGRVLYNSKVGEVYPFLWMEHPRAAVLQNAPAGES